MKMTRKQMAAFELKLREFDSALRAALEADCPETWMDGLPAFFGPGSA